MDPVANPSAIQEHSLEVTRTARVYTLGGGDATQIDECWIACHGYRQLARRFMRRFKGIAGPSRMVVAPEALSRFYVDSDGGRHGAEARVGATWMTREDRLNEIADYVSYLDIVARRFQPDGDRVCRRVAFGFSQGVHTASRWAVMGQTPVDRLILWGAYVPPDLDLDRFAERWSAMDVVQVHGEEDPSRSERLAHEQAERLTAAGLSLTQRSHAGGHIIDAELLAELAELAG